MVSTLTGSRPSTDEYFAEMVRLVASRGTCLRRRVGCVIVDAQHHVLATGYNGVHRGAPHCNEVVRSMATAADKVQEHWMPLFHEEHPHACPGAHAPSGTALTDCRAVHAEQNALLQCRDRDAIHTVYCTASPCVTCMRMLANTSVKRIVFLEEYPHAESRSIAASLGIEWTHFGPT
jgi:dCMP deaminase